ncbi:MAG: hypothetical protein EA342_13345 [Leptolyngbya sp. LCM1.Bin17]|nr:MAG: hypothetical protein EA342_13345 [Leptolyngbya sp. LCM1.Bin17]
MDNVFRYWQLVRLTSTGQPQTLEMVTVKSWLEATYADMVLNLEESDGKLQKALLALWQDQREGHELAQMSLRCWISHQIRNSCTSLARRYGDRYGFKPADLLPLVLDDEGHPHPTYRPLSLKILDSFDPTKASLSTWCSRLTKSHPALSRLLLEKGIYLASDWAILNDSTPDQVQRILRDYHLCSDFEVEQAAGLLECYQAVYQRDRLLQRQTGQAGRCPEPTAEQLRQMVPSLSPKTVKAQLKHLASQLRQYRIHVRSGNPQIYQTQDDSELERIVGAAQATSDGEDEAATFLARYREVLDKLLGQTIAQTIAANLARLGNRNPPQDWAYVQGLHLRLCEGMAMAKIAPRIGLSSQVQVTRLLNLKRLRSDVRHQLIPPLAGAVRQDVAAVVSADRLQALDATLETLLAEQIDTLMADAAAEAQAPKPRLVKSRFADQLCAEIHAFMTGQAP